MTSRGRRRHAVEEEVAAEPPAPVVAPWKHAASFAVRPGVLLLSARVDTRPQEAADAESFLNSVVRLVSAEQPAEASGGAFEHLDALAEELQRCAGLRLGCGACARLTAAPRRSVREELEQRETRVRAHVKELETQASQHEDTHAVRRAPGRASCVLGSEFALAGRACRVERLC